MAFWATNLGRGSQIDTILDKEDVTLNEILDQPEVIQECKANQNKKLIDFLTRTDILNQLLDLILQEPDPSLDEKTRYKLPNVASEIITCDVKQINEKLSSDPSMLDKLYNFLDTGEDTHLNPLLTSFFSKVFSVFITRRSEQDYYAYQFTCFQVVNYIKSKPNFLGLLLNHIHTSAILDLLLRLIKCVEGDFKCQVLNWLNEGNLIQRCIQMFAPCSKQSKPVTQEASLASQEASTPSTEGEVSSNEEMLTASAGESDPSPGKEEDVEMNEDKEEGEKEEDQVTANAPSQSSTEEEYFSEENLRIRDMHDNLGQLLVEIIRGSRDFLLSATSSERFHNSLLHTAESKQVCQSLIDVMLVSPARESVIVNIVSVLLCLLEVRKPMNMEHGFVTSHDQGNAQTAADIQHQEEVLMQTVNILVPSLPSLVNLLANPPAKPTVVTTAGSVSPPFGASRLSLCKLLATLMATKNKEVNLTLATTQLLNTQLDLFFQYTLNNFLHCQTESTIRSILQWEPIIDLNKSAEPSQPNLSDTLQTPKVETENPLEKSLSSELDNLENPLLVQLFTEARLLERLVEAWEKCENDPKISYMGHITQITNSVVDLMKEKEGETPAMTSNRISLEQIFSKLPEELMSRWEDVIQNKLTPVNTNNEIKSYREKHSSDDDSDFRDIQFPQDSTLQQRFSNYCIQLMNDNLEDTFGFTSEDFNDVEESYGKMTASDSCLVVTDETKKAIFEKICSARGGCDSEDEEDIWADKTAQITFGQHSVSETNKSEDAEEHSSEEEDETGGGGEDRGQDKVIENMEVDHDNDPWTVESSSAAVAMDTSAPWEASQAPADGGWANFDTPAAESSGSEGEGWASFESGPASGPVDVPGDGPRAENWADFSSLDAAGGEGFGSSNLGEVQNKEKGDDWTPAMSSSPEATMLDEFENRMEAAGLPVLRPESPDLSNSNANHAPVPSDFSKMKQAATEEEGQVDSGQHAAGDDKNKMAGDEGTESTVEVSTAQQKAAESNNANISLDASKTETEANTGNTSLESVDSSQQSPDSPQQLTDAPPTEESQEKNVEDGGKSNISLEEESCSSEA